MFSHSQIRSRRDRGYVMMTLLLTMALLLIFAAAIVPSITFEIKRDREEEMVHRGVQYSRAIKAYYRKFNRYPMKIEDLENTNQLRFLRKRYKDPLTGKDFKLLHFGEVKMSMGGGQIPGANVIGANGTLGPAGGLTQTTAFGGNSAFGANTTSRFSGGGAFGSDSNSAFGQNQQPAANQNAASDSQQQGSDTPQQGAQPGAAGTGTNPADAKDSSSTSKDGSSTSGDKLASTTFGGTPVVGVASTSKDTTIREYDKKKKYNEWQFVYDPTLDRGFLITTPYQPQLQMFGAGPQNINGPQGTQNGTASGFGNSFGNSNGFGNSPSPMQNNPTQPVTGYGGAQPNSPPQQQ